jgi:hypothetical protein
MTNFSSCSLDELIEVMTTWPAGVPVRAMERVLALGEPAVPRLSDALHRWQTEDSRDLLWPIVLLGELRNPSAIEPLADQIRRTEEEELGLAAAEGLVKIGAASLPALCQVAADTDSIVRIYGYAALGWLRHDEAFSILLDALSRDLELADVVAQALGDQGRKEAIPVLYDAYRNCSEWQRVEFEDALRDLHFGSDEPLSWTKNWKTRYRREPFWGRFEFGWVGIAVMVRREVEALAQRVSPPLKSLEEILSEQAQPQDSAEHCDDCGGLVERTTGLPVCPETALRAALYQVRFLGEARNDGVKEIFDLFDNLDKMLFQHYEEEQFLKERERKSWEARGEDLRLHRETCRWLVEQGVEDIAGARSLLLAKAAWLAGRDGDPEGLLSPARRSEKPAPKVGRNDPCPCGSGKKYKRCCLGDPMKAGTGKGTF